MCGVAIWGGMTPNSVEGWVTRNGVSPHDQITADSGTAAWRERMTASFPTIQKLNRLASGHFFDEEVETLKDVDANRLDAMRLTLVGFTIAETILEQILSTDFGSTSPQ